MLLAVAFAPGKVPTLRSMWQPGSSGQLAAGNILATPVARVVAVVVLVVLMVVFSVIGYNAWSDVPPLP